MRIRVSDLIPVRLLWKKDELGVCKCVCFRGTQCPFPYCKGKLARIYLELHYFHVDEH